MSGDGLLDALPRDVHGSVVPNLLKLQLELEILFSFPSLGHDVPNVVLALKELSVFFNNNTHAEMIRVPLSPIGLLHHFLLVDQSRNDGILTPLESLQNEPVK